MKYAVTFTLNKCVFGSGTLVSAGRHKGILTAAHVVRCRPGERESHLEEPGADVRLIISFEPHDLKAPNGSLTAIYLVRGDEDEDGPDLAFLELHPHLVETLEARKSFYPLGREMPAELSPAPHRLTWVLVGSPRTMSQIIESPDAGPDILHADNLFTFPTLETTDSRKGFDYLRFRVPAGTKQHPERFGGASGGGIWATQMRMDKALGTASLAIPPPHLAGVLFYQYTPKNGESVVVAHGPRSLEVAASKIKTL